MGRSSKALGSSRKNSHTHTSMAKMAMKAKMGMKKMAVAKKMAMKMVVMKMAVMKKAVMKKAVMKMKKMAMKKSKIGSRRSVWLGTKQKTRGGLKKEDLKLTKKGKIVSKK